MKNLPSSACLRKSRAGFSLTELLVVMAIMGFFVVVAMPSFHNIFAGSNLNRAGQLVSDQMALARQEAVTRNREVRVYFYKIRSGTTENWRAMQIWRVETTDTGTTTTAVSKLTFIPDGVIISPTTELSPLLGADTTLTGTVNLPVYGNSSYVGYRYRPDGSTDTSVTVANDYLTLQNATATGNPPANYYTIQINPLVGKVTVYRP